MTEGKAMTDTVTRDDVTATAREHNRDEDCEGHINAWTLQCDVCGVDHSGECLVCGGRGFHKDGCPEIG